MSSTEENIFKRGSTTYYWSAKFFPRSVREDVFKLYSFVRVTDDCIDKVPSDRRSFETICALWRGDKPPRIVDPTLTRVVENMRQVADRYNFESVWTESFLASMRMDLDQRRYQTIADSLEYVYGSAEVIGLMMSKIMGLPESAYPAAQMQGRAMQWINFLRDIEEDNQLGRMYLPKQDLKQFGLKDVTKQSAEAKPQAFNEMMRFELDRYSEWQEQANEGFAAIPNRLRGPLRTAVDMYNWTAQKIAQDPPRVFEHKIKPSKWRVIMASSRYIGEWFK